MTTDRCVLTASVSGYVASNASYSLIEYANKNVTAIIPGRLYS